MLTEHGGTSTYTLLYVEEPAGDHFFASAAPTSGDEMKHFVMATLLFVATAPGHSARKVALPHF